VSILYAYYNAAILHATVYIKRHRTTHRGTWRRDHNKLLLRYCIGFLFDVRSILRSRTVVWTSIWLLATCLTTAGLCLRPVDMLCSHPTSWHIRYRRHTTAPVTGVLPPSACACGTICHPFCDMYTSATNSLSRSWRHFYLEIESTALSDVVTVY